MAIVVIEICKFTLASRVAPHIGRGDAKVHFVVEILLTNHQVGLHQVTGSFIKFHESYIFSIFQLEMLS